MTATDELRRMLDERGVEWKAPASYDGSTKYDTIVDGYWFHENDGKITVHYLTPEQAITAALGDSDVTAARQDDAGTCTLGKVCDGYLYFMAHWCSECGTRFAFRAIGSGKNARPNYCPNCGRKVVTDG